MSKCTCRTDGKYKFCMKHFMGPPTHFNYGEEPEQFEEVSVPDLREVVRRLTDLEGQLRELTRIVDLHLKGQDLYGPRTD